MLGHAATASAARPATHIDPATALRVIQASPTSLHAGGARGGQRGGFVPAARRHAPTPPPTTRAADSQQRADACDRELRAALGRELESDGTRLVAAFSRAPSVEVTRHLWRVLDSVWTAPPRDAALAVTVFALPLVVVAGVERGGDPCSLPGALPHTERLAAILREHGALKGNRTIALGDALVAAETIDIARLPQIRKWQQLPDALAPGAMASGRDLVPAPIAVPAGSETVHLRFLLGTAIAVPAADLLAEPDVGRWHPVRAATCARACDRRRIGVVLPRAPQRLPPSRPARSAARGPAQLFAANAIRRFRSSVGEPLP